MKPGSNLLDGFNCGADRKPMQIEYFFGGRWKRGGVPIPHDNTTSQQPLPSTPLFPERKSLLNL